MHHYSHSRQVRTPHLLSTYRCLQCPALEQAVIAPCRVYQPSVHLLLKTGVVGRASHCSPLLPILPASVTAVRLSRPLSIPIEDGLVEQWRKDPRGIARHGQFHFTLEQLLICKRVSLYPPLGSAITQQDRGNNETRIHGQNGFCPRGWSTPACVSYRGGLYDTAISLPESTPEDYGSRDGKET